MKKYCGDFGGLNKAGGPCRALAGAGLGHEHAGKGPCHRHVDQTGGARLATQRAFLAAYSRCGKVSPSARAVGIDRNNHYQWLEEEPGYRDLFEVAKREFPEYLEAEAVRRAVEGDREYLYGRNGKPVMDPRTGEQAYKIKRSDVLLICSLNAELPEKYRQRHEVSGPGGGPIPMKHDLYDLSIEELAARREAALGSTAGAE